MKWQVLVLVLRLCSLAQYFAHSLRLSCRTQKYAATYLRSPVGDPKLSRLKDTGLILANKKLMIQPISFWVPDAPMGNEA